MYALRFLSLLPACFAAVIPRNPIQLVRTITDDGLLFKLGNISYFANTKYPVASFAADHGFDDSYVPVTVVVSNATSITSGFLKQTISEYAESDDVFSEDFLASMYISTIGNSSLESSASEYFASINASQIWANEACSIKAGTSGGVTSVQSIDVSPGPYLATFGNGQISLSSVYRLYEDIYRNFLYGAYETNDGMGSFASLDVSDPSFSYPVIPVPSRLYSLLDPRPFAGYRVAIKDLYDMKGLKTTAGSQAWAYINHPATATAPSIQRIIDLGGKLIGKYKLAQFASGANPWDWQDEHYPFNPRGDGWLTCSASSSGGGCSIAAYDWLDYAIGSDTGSSMRRPAAVSGTYGQRPSQGMISLERVVPLGNATDTAGVFSRDPYKWVHFSKHWYTPDLYQSPEITGLSALSVPDTDAFPKTIWYPVDYLPLNNSAAEPILNAFIANMSSIFGMAVKRFNFTATVQSNSTPAAVRNLTALNNGPITVINTASQWEAVANPLITKWAELFDGRFPPIDPARRPGWRNYNETANSDEAYAQALQEKNAAVEWYEANLQYSTPESCSESVMLYDIGTGGLPSYREQDLNNNPNASFLAVTPPGAAITGASICPLYGCADFTIPIGQVPYYSEVTFHTEMVPVTINMVVKRGCDFVLYNMIEKLADHGVLKTVKTGRTAF